MDGIPAAATASGGRRALLTTLGTWFAVLGAGAILAGSGPSSALVRIGIPVGLAGVLLAWPGWSRLPGIAPALVLAAWGGVSIWWAGHADPDNGYNSPMVLIIPLAAAIGAVAWRRPAAAQALDRLFAIACLGTFVLVLLQLAIGWDRDDATRWHVQADGVRWTKAAGYFYNHTNAGILFGALAVFAASARGSEHLPRIARWAAIAVGIAGTAASCSRTCFAGMAVGLLIAFYRPGRRIWPVVAIVGGAFAAFVAFTLLTRPGVVSNTLALREPRLPLWHVGATIAIEHPVLGVGGSQRVIREAQRVFPRLYPGQKPEFEKVLPEPHSSFTGYAANFGFPGLALWLASLGAVAWAAIRSRGGDRALVLALLCVYLAAAVGSMVNQQIDVAPLFYLLLGSCFVRLHRPDPLAEASSPARSAP